VGWAFFAGDDFFLNKKRRNMKAPLSLPIKGIAASSLPACCFQAGANGFAASRKSCGFQKNKKEKKKLKIKISI